MFRRIRLLVTTARTLEGVSFEMSVVVAALPGRGQFHRLAALRANDVILF